MNVWTETFHIRSYEIDPTGAVSVRSVFNYLQEAAGAHARSLGLAVDQLLERDLSWFLARLHVEMDAYPGWGDALRIETWPSGENGLLATREFLLFDGDGAPIGRASSAWMVIDIVRRRPIRIPAFVSEIRLPGRDRALPEAPRLPALDGVDREARFRVRYSDLDLNRHVNNAHYPEWAVAALPTSFVEPRHLAAVEVQFRQEAMLDDVVVSEAGAPEDDGTVRHRLRREADDAELALVRTHWR